MEHCNKQNYVNDPNFVELSVVIPCLNEVDTLKDCIAKAQRVLTRDCISGEIIVADNGSTDASRSVADHMGVKVIEVTVKGYGSALMGGISIARGKYIIMADADGSYDFTEIPKFLEKLRSGFDLVVGCRLSSGGGKVMPYAMPFLHRWLGNPLFSYIVRSWFKAPIHDVHCGMRGFSMSCYKQLDLQCIGMEFASEMIIKACYLPVKISEVPIILYPDKRKSHKRHLRTFKDGWRHLRFYLIYSPRWLFLLPGIVLVILGFIGYCIAMPKLSFMGITFDVHTLLFASLSILCGYQSIIFAFLAKTYAINERLKPNDLFMIRFWQILSLEKGLLIGSTVMFVGGLLLLVAILQWRNVRFGMLDYSCTMRWSIPGVTLTMIGFQTILFSFFASILGLHKK